jgi:hypothetical protein
MEAGELFEIWAPVGALWSQWAKPGAFTGAGTGAFGVADFTNLPDLYTWHSGLGDTGAIVNLPGVASIKFGLALAKIGYRPVPLFNSVDGPGAIYDIRTIKTGLLEAAAVLSSINIPQNAPPAFLLDANRMVGKAKPGDFDNRWVVFPQDFPSGTFLLAHGIKKMIVVQGTNNFDRDLGQVLAFWKRAGIEILIMNGPEEMTLHPAENLKPVSRLNFARAAFGAFLIVSLGLRRSNAGGFGSVIPTPDRYG